MTITAFEATAICSWALLLYSAAGTLHCTCAGAGEQRSPAISVDLGMDVGGSTDTSATGTNLTPTQLPLPQGSILRGAVNSRGGAQGSHFVFSTFACGQGHGTYALADILQA